MLQLRKVRALQTLYSFIADIVSLYVSQNVRSHSFTSFFHGPLLKCDIPSLPMWLNPNWHGQYLSVVELSLSSRLLAKA